ncbi:MAG TPA: XRE family transcriptional regulator [Eubacterium sp.]|nr:XRE family transcriptional regulator [Eubacterium sp.]
MPIFLDIIVVLACSHKKLFLIELSIFRITQIRLSKGISARELSFRIHKNAGYISSMENGKVIPSIQTIYEICVELDISLSSLFDLNTNTSTLFKKVTEKIAELDDEDLSLIYSLVVKLKSNQNSHTY